MRVIALRLRAASLIALSALPAGAQSTTERATEAFLRNQIDSAVILFAQAARENPRDASVHAWLAEAHMRAGKSADSAREVDEALRLDPCNAQAYFVRASLSMPRFAARGEANDDATWTNLTRSIACDPTDGNTWADVWKYAIIRRDTAMETRALRALVSTGFLTAPQLTYAEWVLRALPPRAVLLTGGDLDTYAALAVQSVRRVRPDVAIMNVVMLGATWYSQPMLARHDLRYDPRAVTDSTMRGFKPIIAWLRRESVSGALNRPVAFAITVPTDTTSGTDVLQLAGPFWIVMPSGSARTNSTRINAAFNQAEKLDWRGTAASPLDRTPMRHRQIHPALIAAHVSVLERALAPKRGRERIRWTRHFLTRAGVDRTAIDEVLQQLQGTDPH